VGRSIHRSASKTRQDTSGNHRDNVRNRVRRTSHNTRKNGT